MACWDLRKIMTTKDQLSKAYLEAAWSMRHLVGIRKLKAIRASANEEKELKWCYLGFMYDHLADPNRPSVQKKWKRPPGTRTARRCG